ncbi:unnamed protein product [Tilletia controversa]|uniref:Major facilitator superfamily (MFS) profile domain-containing protein n=3 Tax=Tilletia TaxID=13289 RepID=A0A8X7MKA4_9BASI|nr:hypothetical protein CF336_g8009 [Tilletia laevis]KAE8184939.1 hypothetical protein CF328_g7699 [Tilletia controversa]KAE8244422.1 hypothetical protein A4X03_0g7545 [Tilletia caries]KAE8185913.1 hypothetical protein CF335_g7594 [Tilletia laevis]KAE8239244.1 hypothetical protein A4X06_0g8425 [Tilletia controversa]
MRDFTHGLFSVPSKEERIRARAGAPLNPFKLAAMLTPMEAAFFFSGWLAWTVDAWDFFAVSLSVGRLTEYFGFGEDRHKVTTAITLTLLFRSLGAVIFGILSDRYGRKWPLVINLLIVSVLSLGTGYVRTFNEFLAVRSLFGVGMGGIWGMATTTALENMPAAPRGLFSGILQQGYAVGYLLAASVNISYVNRTNNFRILFFLGSGVSLFAAGVRLLLPESPLFLRVAEERRQAGGDGQNKASAFMSELKQMLKTNWLRCIYGVLLMTGFNFFSHASQDVYPLIMQESKLLSSYKATEATIIGNCGAIFGGLIAGYISQYLGRRLTIIIFVILAGVMIPAWILPNSFSGLAAGAFFVQMGVQGAWGVVPILLSEISPPAFRATFPGVAYQLGNMASSASAQIETTGGDNLRRPNPKYVPGSTLPETIPDYATVSAIFLGVIVVYLLIVVSLGPEYRGAEFEKAPLATQPGAGAADAKDLVGLSGQTRRADGGSEDDHISEKGDLEKGGLRADNGHLGTSTPPSDKDSEGHSAHLKA